MTMNKKNNKNNKKGFTLAELLIVVAIIAVLTAIAIPVFAAQLHKSQDATDLANIRSYYAELQSEALANGSTNDVEGVSTGRTEAGSEVTFLNGGKFKLNNLWMNVAENDSETGFVVTWGCSKGDDCKSKVKSGSFGGSGDGE